MNKAITDGVILTPPGFSEGLDVWSDQDGTPGSTTYDGAGNAAFVPADQDFGGCLELVKTDATQKLRYMGETPLLPGCYLQIKARVKAMSGNLPNVRIAGWAGEAGGTHVSGVTEVGQSVSLTTYGEIVEISAIVGAGSRTGVDLVWGTTPIFGHFGLDLTGSNGGVVRIESVEITDATKYFYRKLMDWVDVRDFGAIGDGVTDDSAAFEAADAAAGGRTVLVSDGTYYLGGHVTMDARTRFEGSVTMPDDKRLSLTKNFELASYIDAFGDEELAFKKAVQALFNYSDHAALDLSGRRVQLSAPIDVHAAVENKETFSNRRVIRNGQFEAVPGSAWDTGIVTSTADYSSGADQTLSNVANVAQIEVGSLVTGNGVGREIYVRDKDVNAGTVTLSMPLHGASSTQSYTFTRFRYLLDFVGFTSLQRFVLSDIEFLCVGECSGILLPSNGLSFHIRDCFITSPKDRGITSSGRGCSGLQLDRNQFLSGEQSLLVQNRVSIGFNVNANDAKIRDNRAVRFKNFGVLSGTGHMILGNHFFQGDTATAGLRTEGIVLTRSNCKSTITGNYIDNCAIGWTNEHVAEPDNTGSFSFGGLTIEGNIFTSSGSASWFRFIQLRPYGTDHFISGLNISGNTFKHINGGTLERVEMVDTSIAPLDMTKARNIMVGGNTFNNVDERFANPGVVEMEETGVTDIWTQDMAHILPFGGQALRVSAIVPQNKIQSISNAGVYTQPYATVQQGPDNSEVKLYWSQDVKGKVLVTVLGDQAL